jgi:hypothetical protein
VLTYETPAQLARAVTQHLEETPERREHRAEVAERFAASTPSTPGPRSWSRRRTG